MSLMTPNSETFFCYCVWCLQVCQMPSCPLPNRSMGHVLGISVFILFIGTLIGLNEKQKWFDLSHLNNNALKDLVSFLDTGLL